MKCIMSLFYDKIVTTEMHKLSKGLIIYSYSQNFKKKNCMTVITKKR